MKKYGVPFIITLVFFSCCCGYLEHTARVSFTGDIIMHIPVKSCSRNHNRIDPGNHSSINHRGFDFLFNKIRKSLMGSDIVVGNMEFPVSHPFTSIPWKFNCRPEVLPALKNAGFTMLTIANNHILDQGQKGVRSTLSYLKKYSIDCIGAGCTEAGARAGIVREVNGIRIGFIAYTGVLNYPGPRTGSGFHINWLHEKEKVSDDIRNIRSRCDYLVMVSHYGSEYSLQPQKREKDLYRYFCGSGVDLIIGHHPHVLQPVERVTTPDNRTAYIFYSLGNFISNQSSAFTLPGSGMVLSTRDSAIVTLMLRRPLFSSRLRASFEITPVRTDNHFERKTGIREIQTLSIPAEIEEYELALKTAPAGNKSRIKWRLQHLRNKIMTIQAVMLQKGNMESVKVSGTGEKQDRG